MNNILLFAVLIISNYSYSQNTLDNQFEKTRGIFMEHSLIHGDKELFYNKSENVLDFGHFIVPLNLVKIEYFFKQEEGQNFVYLRCFDKIPCINDDIIELGILFKTKENCYDFINALAELNQMNLNHK